MEGPIRSFSWKQPTTGIIIISIEYCLGELPFFQKPILFFWKYSGLRILRRWIFFFLYCSKTKNSEEQESCLPLHCAGWVTSPALHTHYVSKWRVWLDPLKLVHESSAQVSWYQEILFGLVPHFGISTDMNMLVFFWRVVAPKDQTHSFG